jgi:hypothetical protein
VTRDGSPDGVPPAERIAVFDNDGTLWGEQPFYFQGLFAGMTTAEFDTVVRAWLATARHPVTGRPYTEMVYVPMLELLAYLRDQGFKTFIASGGGIEFIRVFAEQVYGIPPEQVIGFVIVRRKRRLT